MKPITELYSQLNQPRKIVITFHQKPDADAMGSGLGLYHLLVQLGHEVVVISPTNWASFLSWMKGADKVLDYEAKTELAKEKIRSAEWLFCLDFNTLSRTKRMEEELIAFGGTRILIDHHQQPQTEMFAYGISNTGKSSTAEMIFDFVEGSGNDDKINEAMAECLYAGVMTDTGSFRFDSTTASVHLMVARLMQTHINHGRIYENLYDNFLENRLRFIGNTLLNRMEVFYEYNTALITIPQSDLIKYQIKTGDTEGLVNFPLSMQGIKLAAIIIDRGDERKSSFRSKGNVDVNTFARRYFNGGGHFHASGGRNTEPMDEVVRRFKQAIKENQSILA